MTRGEEIQKAAKEIAQDIEDWEIAEDIEDAFMEGALWADRTMIDKACDWLDCNVDNYLFIDYLNTAGIKWDKFINDFKQAMEGGQQ